MAAGGMSSDADIVIGIGPVVVPEYLDRKEILTHDQRYRVSAAEFDRWAEPLEHNIASALATNLSMLGPASNVVAYPWDAAYAVDYSIRLHVHAFGTRPGGDVLLSASWVLVDSKNDAIKLGNSQYTEARQGDDVVATVAAMSQALEQLSREISEMLVVASVHSTSAHSPTVAEQQP